MPLKITDLFPGHVSTQTFANPSPSPSPAQAAPPVPGTPPLTSPPPQPQLTYDPRLDVLGNQVQQLTGAVTTLLQRQAQIPGPVQPAQGPPRLDQEVYFEPDDGRRLLQTQRPDQVMNEAMHRMGHSIQTHFHDPIMARLAQNEQAMQNFFVYQTRLQQEREARALAEKNEQEFFDQFPDLKDAKPVVYWTIDQIRQESQVNPMVFYGRDARGMQQLAAERTREHLARMGVPVRTQQVQGPGNAYMERGGLPHLSQAPQTQDANKQAMKDIFGRLGGFGPRAAA